MYYSAQKEKVAFVHNKGKRKMASNDNDEISAEMTADEGKMMAGNSTFRAAVPEDLQIAILDLLGTCKE